MFKIVDYGGMEFTVYSVKCESGKTYFLIYDGWDWKWVNSVSYKPVED